MKDRVFGDLLRIGRSFMLPIALLPVAGLLLGLSSSFTNETMLSAYGLSGIMGRGTVINAVLSVMSAAGSSVFNNLPLIFAIGVAIGMAKREKDVAALAAAIAFIIMHSSLSAMLLINGGGESVEEACENLIASGHLAANSYGEVLGIVSLDMGVFGGIIVGLGTAALHNRFYKIELPQVLSFFGGTRFVPIISSLCFVIVGILMYFIWPFAGLAIAKVGDLVLKSGYIGTFIYGFMERLLIPFGLHHVFYLPFWQTALGGTMEVAGVMVSGAQNIFFAQLADPTVERFAVSATRFMSGKFPLMIFGLPGAALAMYQCAKPEKKQAVGALLLSAALTSMVTGITEPLEFTFLFVAPLLYGIHCIFAGLAYMFMHIFNVGVGMTFSGGIIDLVLFGVLPGLRKTNWLWIVAVGAVYFVVYWLLFSYLIKKLNLMTPGREEDTEEVKLYTRSDVNEKKGKGSAYGDVTSALIVKGLGGKSNISDVDCCATRLRITVFDPSLVDEASLKSSGASGVIKKGDGVQVVYGPKVSVIKSKLQDFLESPESESSDLLSVNNNPSETASASKKSSVSCDIFSPLSGRLLSLDEVADGVFSEGMLGEGAAIEPSDGKVYAPFDGEVSLVYDTKHALGLKSKDGVELLIHFGLDTVELKGKYFKTKVSQGQKIKKGSVIMEADIEAIKKAGYRTVTPVIITNTDDCEKITIADIKTISAGQKLIHIGD
ncbi:MAG: glucose PTS transporter subunit IIA [Clostridiales bacterium]|nr:glucose PTS transporter subunit IIA [Clostridiales bacterium]